MAFASFFDRRIVFFEPVLLGRVSLWHDVYDDDTFFPFLNNEDFSCFVVQYEHSHNMDIPSNITFGSGVLTPLHRSCAQFAYASDKGIRTCSPGHI